MTKKILAWGLLVLTFVFAGPAESAEINCPSTLDVAESADGPAGGEWDAMSEQPGATHHFVQVVFSEGPPSQHAYIEADRVIWNRKYRIEIYFFPPPDRHPVWIGCQYNDTYMVLAHPLTVPHQRCTVTYDPVRGFAVVKEVKCR